MRFDGLVELLVSELIVDRIYLRRIASSKHRQSEKIYPLSLLRRSEPLAEPQELVQTVLSDY